MSCKAFSRKDAKALRKTLRVPGVFLCAFASLREKSFPRTSDASS